MFSLCQFYSRSDQVFSIGAGSSGGPEISIQSSSAQRASRNLDPLPCARPAPDLRGPGRSHWPSEVLCFLRVHGPVRSFTRATLQDAPLFSWYSQVLPRCFSSVLTSQVALPSGPIVPRDRGVGPVRDEDESQRQAYDSDSQPADGRPAIEQMGEYDALHNGTMLPPETAPAKGEGSRHVRAIQLSQTLSGPRPRRTGVHFPPHFINPWQLTTPTGRGNRLKQSLTEQQERCYQQTENGWYRPVASRFGSR